MRNNRFFLPELAPAHFSISHSAGEESPLMNHNETHTHKECEIYLNLSGDVSFEVENRIYPVSRGTVIITRPYEYHHCIFRSPARHAHYWITFSAEQTETFLKMFFDREKGKDNLILLDEDGTRQLCAVLDDLLKKEADPLKRRIDFLMIFHILSAGKRAEYTDTIEGLPEDVATALLFMDDHLTEDLDIRTIAAACSVSVNTLGRHFRETLACSPIVMLRNKRLIRSRDLLRNGAAVSEAALKSGFSDYSNYIQLFRKRFGITPLQYKKQFETK